MKRYAPIPLVQAGGIQPYHGSTPQPPGAPLTAMLRGATFGGMNPQDAPRGLQTAARRGRRQQTLLDLLGQQSR